MSQHSSLRSNAKDTIHRSVLKRFERFKDAKDKEKWDDEESSVYRLPKQKIVKFKIKKEKSEKAAGAEGAEGAAAAATPAAGAAGAPAKDAAAKTPSAKPEAKGKDAKK